MYIVCFNYSVEYLMSSTVFWGDRTVYSKAV